MASRSPTRHGLPQAYGDFNTRRYTIVHGFFLFNLFLIGGKELNTYNCLLRAHKSILQLKRITRLASVPHVGTRLQPRAILY